MSGNIEAWAPIHYTCQRALNKYKLTWANFRPALCPNQNKLWARFSSSPSGFRLIRMKSVSVFIISTNTSFKTINYLLTYVLTYLLTYLLTPWSRVLLEKLTGLQLLKKFPAFYGTRKFVTAFTISRPLSLT